MPRARVVVTPQTRPEGGRPPEVPLPDNEGKGIHKIFRTSITPYREMPFVRQRDDGIHVSPETREVM